MMWNNKCGKVGFSAAVALFGTLAFTTTASFAGSECNALPSHAQLRTALQTAVGTGGGGFGLQMWATMVNRDGIVCAVAFSGANRGDQWPGSRVISAQKANTANAFSLPGLPLSTANLYSAVQPGGSLFGLQHSNPVDTEAAYGASPPTVDRITTRWRARRLVASMCSVAAWDSMRAVGRSWVGLA